MNAHHKTVIHIDRNKYETSENSLTGSELRALPNPPIGPDRDLYEEVPGGEDILIADSQSVTLRNGMHFFTAPHSITPGR